jgi:diguanylate cyclase (GGDEF)-like protein
LRFQVLALMICPVICFTTQSLVQRVRWQSQELETLAGTDALTNIPNRRSWDDELPRALARALRLNEMVCVALLDLDNFKQYNDTHGHQAGDMLLQEVVSAWSTTLRTSDFMARYGGEEFAVIFPSCPLHEAVNVLNRVRAAMPQGETCSIGVAEWDRHELSADLLERTDSALYVAKRKGRNRTELSPLPMPSFV